jgi:hypothetical protein
MRRLQVVMAATFALSAIGGEVRAADHRDGASVLADPATDINDVFAWTDGTKVHLVMTVHPAATTTSKFSNSALYTFHTTSRASYGATAQKEDIVCRFDASQNIECWAGTEYVTGNASATTGIESASKKLKVFAGLRKDPFFFNLDGFKAVATTVTSVKGSLTFNANGCPQLDAATSTALVNQLKGSPPASMGGMPGAPVDFFAQLNTLAIVLTVDKAVVTKGGPIMGVWGSTNAK